MLSVSAYASVCVSACVCMSRLSVCVQWMCVLSWGGAEDLEPDCRNPEVVVAITGRVLHNAPGCCKSCREDGGVKGPCEPSKPHRELIQRGNERRMSGCNSSSTLLNWLFFQIGAFLNLEMSVFWGLRRSTVSFLLVKSVLSPYWSIIPLRCEILSGMFTTASTVRIV